jgi:hypothetical protein
MRLSKSWWGFLQILPFSIQRVHTPIRDKRFKRGQETCVCVFIYITYLSSSRRLWYSRRHLLFKNTWIEGMNTTPFWMRIGLGKKQLPNSLHFGVIEERCMNMHVHYPPTWCQILLLSASLHMDQWIHFECRHKKHMKEETKFRRKWTIFFWTPPPPSKEFSRIGKFFCSSTYQIIE